MLMAIILLISNISTKEAQFMVINIKDFYINTPMTRPEFLTCQKKSSNYTTFGNLPPQMDMSMYKCGKVCMDFHEQESFRNNSSNNTSQLRDITKAPSPLVSGTRLASNLICTIH